MIGIDVGRAVTKVTANGVVCRIPSRVGEARALRLETNLDYTIEIDGQRYWVGEAADESHWRRQNAEESKVHQETKLLFLTALAAIVPENHEGPLAVTTGVPVYQHHNDVKTGMRALLLGRHRVSLNGGAPRELWLRDLLIVPEGAGAFWSLAANDNAEVVRGDLLRNRRTRLIDIGSRTVNYISTAGPGGRYLDRESGTLPYGWLEVEAAGGGPEAVRGLALRVSADLSRVWADLRAGDHILLAGGGAAAVEPHLPYAIRQVVPEPDLANVIGYRRLGMFYADSIGN